MYVESLSEIVEQERSRHATREDISKREDSISKLDHTRGLCVPHTHTEHNRAHTTLDVKVYL